MPTNCQLKFSRISPIYYSGEQISGSCILSTTKQLPLEAIQLSLIGTEQVKWLERNKAELLTHNDSIENDDNKIRYNGKRQIFCETYTLAKRVRLQPGEVHLEQFCFTLPQDAPASCSLKYGAVTYHIQLTLQRKSTCNKVYKTELLVKNRLDLNEMLMADMGEPKTVMISNVPSYADALPPLRFELPNGLGYVPGQSIAYTLQGRRAPCNKQQHFYVNLYQRNTFRATHPTEKVKEVCNILKYNLHKISASATCINFNDNLNIPLTTFITAQHNENAHIQTSYFIEAVLVNKKRILQKVSMPIVLGTVPLSRGRRRSSNLTPPLQEEVVDYIYCYDNLANEDLLAGACENDLLKADAISLLSTTFAAASNLYTFGHVQKQQQHQHVAATCSFG